MGPQKVEYWRKRMLDKWDQFKRGYEFHFQELNQFGVHAQLESEQILAAQTKVNEGLEELRIAITEAKSKW